MKYLVFVLLFCSFYSCHYYEKKKLDSNTILMEELKTFNWTQNIIVTQTVSDTIIIELLVSNEGKLQISKIQTNELTKEQIPILDSILVRSLEGLPKLYPAIKRSQQVQTAFQLPIILSVD
jgi:uncharacterized protein YcbK (DUF882 family)